LKRKAESAGGSFTKFSTQKTALSQTHLTGARIKKSLSERVHYDSCGVVMHRDLLAFLADTSMRISCHCGMRLLRIRDGIHPARGMAVLSTICESKALLNVGRLIRP